MDRFSERLASGPPIVGDGGMGTLVSSAVARLRCPEEANLRAPESVLSLHLGFIRAGAELIETNTFGANRHKLRTHFLEDDVKAINEAGVKIARDAREVSGRDVFIAGSIGPLGEIGARRDDREALFTEQAELLEGRGVDLFLVETFYELDELETAIRGGPLRVVPSDRRAAHLRRGRAHARWSERGARGSDARRAGRCGDRGEPRPRPAGGASRARADERQREAPRRLAERGPGKPRRAPGHLSRTRRPSTSRTSPRTPRSSERGSSAAAAARHRRRSPRSGTPSTRGAARAHRWSCESVSSSIAASEPEQETLLQQKLRAGEFVVSVEIDPPRGGQAQAMLDLARTLKESGHVDVVDVNDNPRARARMSGLIASATIERVAGIETIPHLTPRDSSIAGLESMLLGAHAEGIRNVLAVTGDPPEAGDYPGSGGVYEVDSIGLSRIITHMNAGEDFNGREIDAPTSFFLGVAVNPAADDLGYELERFEQKLEAGAKFAMTQVLFDFAYLDDFIARLGRPCPIPLLIGIFYVKSYQLALRLHNEVPGIVVPDHVQERLREAGANAAEVGLAIARELLEESRERAAGVYVIPPFRQPLAALELFS